MTYNLMFDMQFVRRLYIQFQMFFNSSFKLLLLYADVLLCNGGTAVLEQLLNKNNVISVVNVYFGCVVLPKAVSTYIFITEIVTNNFQLLLDCSF